MRRYHQARYTAYAAWGKTQAMERMERSARHALSDADSALWDEDRIRETQRSIGALPGLTPEQRVAALRRFDQISEDRRG